MARRGRSHRRRRPHPEGPHSAYEETKVPLRAVHLLHTEVPLVLHRFFFPPTDLRRHPETSDLIAPPPSSPLRCHRSRFRPFSHTSVTNYPFILSRQTTSLEVQALSSREGIGPILWVALTGPF